MAIDYTRLLSKLNPEPGGEDVLRLRTGVIDAINSDGTVDVGISGLVVPDVHRLDGLVVLVGQYVQVLTYRGGALVLGGEAVAPGLGGGQPIAYNSADTDSVAGGSGAEIVILTVTAQVVTGRTYRVWAEFHATPSSAGVAGSVRIREGGNLAGTELRVAYADFPNAGTAGNHFFLSTKYTATSTGSQSFTATAQATGATVRREAAGNRLTEMWVTTSNL